MNANRHEHLSSVDINTYDLERDGLIALPIEQALELSDRLQNQPDAYLEKHLTQSKPHTSYFDSENHAAFEVSNKRILFLGLHFALNKRELIAPIFRPQLLDFVTTKSDEPKSLINVIYSLDQQLIDLHWAYC